MQIPHISKSPNPELQSDHQPAVRSFTQMFGIHPGIAFLILVVDSMLFGSEVVTLGSSLVFSLPVAIALGFIVYRAQMQWSGDPKEEAFVKAAITTLLIGLPVPVPAMLSLPTGLLGLISKHQKK